MKILQITAAYKKGSVGKISKSIHDFLISKGEESYVCYGVETKEKTEKGEIQVCNKFLRGINKIKYFFTGVCFNGSNLSTNRIIKTIKKINPDIVHIHCLNDYYLNVDKLFSYLKEHNIKTMFTMHCEHYYTGSCGYALTCNKWKEGGCDNSCPLFHKEFKHLPLFDRTKTMFKRMSNAFEGFNPNNLMFCPCTPWLKERMQDSLILSKYNNVIPVLNGADENIYHYYGLENNDRNKKVILYVTPRFNDPMKGSYKINNIAKEFLDDKNVEFHLVGNVPSDFKFEKNIICLGPKMKTELAKEYSKSDVTLMLSEAECFPMICVESLLCGTKIVGFKCGGPDKCYDKSIATFVEQNNYKEMSSSIRKFLSENYSKMQLSNYAKTIVSSNIMCENYYAVYKKFLNIK